MPITLNGDNGITNVNGSAAAPAITGTDTDSGMYFGTNSVALSTAGTAALTVDSSQVVTLANALPAASGGTGLTAPGTSGNILTSNGTAWTSAAAPAGGFGNMEVFTSSGTFTVPAGITKVKVTVVGGGGGGGTTVSGSGGGGGGTAIKVVTGLTPGGTVTVTVGGGGALANSGGTSSFDAFCSATGGSVGGTSGGVGGNGGTGSGGDLNIPERNKVGSGATCV
jgi:hypothetical protein